MKTANSHHFHVTTSVPFHVWILLTCLVFLGVKGILDGITLLLDPSGGLMQIMENEKVRLNIENFSVPGIFLIVFYGLFSLLCILGLLTKKALPFYIPFHFKSKLHWSWWTIFLLGIFLILTNAGNLIMISYINPRPLMMLSLGIVILILLQTRCIKSYLSHPESLPKLRRRIEGRERG